MDAERSTLKTNLWWRRLSVAALAAAFLCVSSVLNGSLVRREKGIRVEESPDSELSASFRWHPELYRLLSFGHVPSSVDWLLIRFLTDGNLAKAGGDRTTTETFRILDLATELDPAFVELYVSGANFLAVARDDRVGALRLVEKGERFLTGAFPGYPEAFRRERWPNAWRIYLTKGYLYLIEFQDARRAAEAYSRMGDFPDAPEGVKRMARNNRSPEGQFNLAANSLKVLRHLHEDDPEFQRDVERRERFLLTARDLVVWNRKFREAVGKRSATAADFERFRKTYAVPSRDRLGGEIFLNPAGRVDTRTEKMPVLGTDLDAILRAGR